MSAPADLHIDVTGGGEPSDEQLAALTMALAQIAGEAVAAGRAGPEGGQRGGWARAALHEAVGQAVSRAASDVPA